MFTKYYTYWLDFYNYIQVTKTVGKSGNQPTIFVHFTVYMFEFARNAPS